MAALEQHGIKAVIKPGPSGSFIVDVDGKVVVEKKTISFPTEEEIVRAVKTILTAS